MKRKIQDIEAQDIKLCICRGRHQKNSRIVLPENADLDNHPWMTVPLWKSGNPVEKFQHTVGGKKSKITCIEDNERVSFTLLAPPSTKIA